MQNRRQFLGALGVPAVMVAAGALQPARAGKALASIATATRTPDALALEQLPNVFGPIHGLLGCGVGSAPGDLLPVLLPEDADVLEKRSLLKISQSWWYARTPHVPALDDSG